jgi:hypothetical protein
MLKRILASRITTVVLFLVIAASAYMLGERNGHTKGYEDGRYAMREHIENVRWVKTFNAWADTYDLYAADVQKKIAAGEPVSAEDRAQVAKEPKIDRQKAFGKIMAMAKATAGKDPTEASWLKINGFSD